MEYRKLGSWGIRVSAFGLGGWLTFGGSVKDEKVVARIVRRAREAGVNFFDIADVYAKGEAERLMGKALLEHPRQHLVVSSKVFWPMSDEPNDRGLSRKHIMESVEASLRRIGTDYLDLYFCHRFDDEVPLEETVGAMDDLVRQGKVLYWGTSEWSGENLRISTRLARDAGAHLPVVEQPVYSLLERGKFETDVLPAALELGMGLVVWSPLASGVLTGKYDRGAPRGSRLEQVSWLAREYLKEEVLAPVRRMKEIADALSVSRAQLALAWAVRRRGVSSVILGATSIEQLDENLKSLDLEIPEDAGRALEEIFPVGT